MHGSTVCTNPPGGCTAPCRSCLAVLLVCDCVCFVWFSVFRFRSNSEPSQLPIPACRPVHVPVLLAPVPPGAGIDYRARLGRRALCGCGCGRSPVASGCRSTESAGRGAGAAREGEWALGISSIHISTWAFTTHDSRVACVITRVESKERGLGLEARPKKQERPMQGPRNGHVAKRAESPVPCSSPADTHR